MTNTGLVSVIVPCFNQGRFLADAIGSVLRQSYNRHEIIVVDDGSTDNSAEVATRFADVRLIRQNNAGLSAARNTGLKASKGTRIVFLDADDRLLPHALEIGTNRLDAHGDCAFAYGKYRVITEDGRRIDCTPREYSQEEPYLRLLHTNYIGMQSAVMYRRQVFDVVGHFDQSLTACEDYDLYLRITRDYPVYRHSETVAEYRQHDSNMSRSSDLMLKQSLSVLRSQWKYARGNKRAREAYRAGVANWRDLYGTKLLTSIRSRIAARDWASAARAGLILLRYYPGGVANKVTKQLSRITSGAPRFFSIRPSR